MAEQDKIWLSHSGVEILNRCPRCFWLRYKKKIYQPEGITSRLPDRFDRIIKKYFDKFRQKEKFPPIIEGKVEGKLENPFQEKYFCDINDDYGFLGKLDECIIDKDGKYNPVDFKTSSSDPEEREMFSAYQNQMDAYALLLELNDKKTSGFGHLIYFYPEESENLHDGFPMKVYVKTLNTNPNDALLRIKKAISFLDGQMPEPAPDCSFCSWYDAISKILK